MGTAKRIEKHTVGRSADELALASLPGSLPDVDDDRTILGGGGRGSSSVDGPNAARGEYFLRIGGARDVSEFPKAGSLLGDFKTNPVSSAEGLAGEVAGVDFGVDEDEGRGERKGCAGRLGVPVGVGVP